MFKILHYFKVTNEIFYLYDILFGMEFLKNIHRNEDSKMT